MQGTEPLRLHEPEQRPPRAARSCGWSGQACRGWSSRTAASQHGAPAGEPSSSSLWWEQTRTGGIGAHGQPQGSARGWPTSTGGGAQRLSPTVGRGGVAARHGRRQGWKHGGAMDAPDVSLRRGGARLQGGDEDGDLGVELDGGWSWVHGGEQGRKGIDWVRLDR